ncbi:hypothetical protein BH10CYA1_BH10CYA1_08650 [soil metagenome]
MQPRNSNSNSPTSLLADNLSRFPTDQDCLNELMKYIEVKCNHCQSKRLETKVGRRDATCLQCHRKTWLTAKTFFGSIKKPRLYLMAITLMGHGFILSGAAFARLLNIATSSAQHIVKKVSSVLVQLMDQACVGATSSEFSLCVMRRSTESPARNHPHAEFDEIEKQLSTHQSNEQAVLDTLSEDEKMVYALFCDQPISLSDLEHRSGLKTGQLMAALSMLEIELLIQKIGGTSYVRQKKVTKPVVNITSKKLNRFIKKSIKLIRACFQGVSRKYLQIYLATCWCSLDRSTWTVTKLFKACATSGKISSQNLIDYVSPPVVLVCPIA